MDFDAASHRHEPQHFAGGRMGEIINRVAHLDFGVHDPVAMLEERRQIPAGQVTILIDGRGQHRAAVSPVPLGVIGPAAEKRNPKWGSTDNHGNIRWASAYDSGVPMSRNLPAVRNTF